MDLLLPLPTAAGRRSGLEQALRDGIRSGRLAAGTRLPATRELAAELGVARGTVVAAYDQLIAEGYLVARHGVDTRVADLPTVSQPTSAPPPPRKALSLTPGVPDIDRFPTADWLRSMRRGLAEAPPAVFGYGDPRGWPPLRAALAAYLGRARGVVCSADQVVVTSGSVQSINLLGQLLATENPGAKVAAEDPGWEFQRDVLTHAGVDVVPAPVDESGVRVDSLSDDVCAALVTPAHQYPTGVVLTPQRRHALIRWARESGGLVIEDDYDGEFRYDRQPVGALQGSAPDHVAYLGSASKTLAPGLRLGWLVLPPRLVDAVVDLRLRLDVHTETLSQVTMTDFLTSLAYDRHIRASRVRYRRRRDALLRELAAFSDVSLGGVSAGLHALVCLPEHTSEAAIVGAAAADGLLLRGLVEHCRPSIAQPPGLVIGYSNPSEHAYPAALAAFTRVLRLHLEPSGSAQHGRPRR